jgi:hypothetical protein
LLIGLALPVFAQQTQLSGGIAAGAISCAPSANGTGHMVCAEYAAAGALYGVSWQVPGTVGPPRQQQFHNGQVVAVVEALNTVDPPQTLGSPAGPLQGAPSCGPANDLTGTAACLFVSRGSTGFILQGGAFYPAPTVVAPALVQLDTKPTAQAISNPSCASANSNGAVMCAIVVDNQLYGIGFEPRTGVNTRLTVLLPGTTGFTGNPNCSSPEGSLMATCAIRQGGGLLGFVLQFNPPSGGVSASVTTAGSIQLGSGAFIGDPGCAIRGNGVTTLTCAIVSGKNLLGVVFDPMAQTVLVGLQSPQSLGLPSDGGAWTGEVGCAGPPDFRNGKSQNGNLISCAVVSNTSNVFAVTFDPVAGRNLGINGPFAANINSVPSCLPLAVDNDQINCGVTRADGTSAGLRIPVGLVPQSVATAAVSILLN